MLLIIDRYRYYFFVTIIIACRLIQCVCKCVRVYIYICTWIYAACCHTSYMFWHNTSKNRAGLQPWLMMALMDTRKSITSYPGGSQGIPGGSQGDPRGIPGAITGKGSVVGATAGLTKVGTCGDLSQTYRTLSQSFWGILPTIMGSNINQCRANQHWYFLHIPTHYSF